MHDLSRNTAENLRMIADEIEAIEPISEHIYTLSFRDLKSPACDELRSKIKSDLGSNFLSIYRFQLCDVASPGALNESIIAALNENDAGIKYPRHNKLDGRCLYVGSSRKTANRLAEHLGFGSAKTYSLQLLHWASGLKGGFTISVFGYRSQDQKRITWLEDRLSENDTPLLGRRGSK
jgi:hypothetical protein